MICYVFGRTNWVSPSQPFPADRLGWMMLDPLQSHSPWVTLERILAFLAFETTNLNQTPTIPRCSEWEHTDTHVLRRGGFSSFKNWHKIQCFQKVVIIHSQIFSSKKTAHIWVLIWIRIKRHEAWVIDCLFRPTSCPGPISLYPKESLPIQFLHK